MSGHEPERDRLLEQMLLEVCGAEDPPDLTARIREELQKPAASPAAAETDSTAPPPRPPVAGIRPSLFWSGLLALAAGFVLGFALLGNFRDWNWSWGWGSDGPVAKVELTVHQGALHYRGRKGRILAFQGAREELELAVGDRFSTGSGGGASASLQPMGVLLKLRENTILEVYPMDERHKKGTVVVGALALGAVVGAFTWDAIARPGEGGEDPAAKGGAGAARAVDPTAVLTAKNLELQATVQKLKEENADLRAAAEREKLAAAEKQPAEEAPTEQPLAADETKGKPAFADAQLAEALATTDWKVVGEAFKEIVPLIGELAKALAEGEKPLELIGKVHQVNGKLIMQAAALEGKVPGCGLNGSFTHPVIAANQLDAALKAGGLPLDKGQRERLETAMQYSNAKDQSLRLSEGDREIALEGLIAEVEYKDEFFAEVDKLLTPKQRALMHCEQSKGRTRLEVYGTGVIWGQYARPVPVQGPEQLSQSMAKRISDRVGLDKASDQRLRQIVDRWSKTFPESYWSDKADSLSMMGMMKSTRIKVAARRQLALIREIMSQIEMNPGQRKSLSGEMQVFVPLPYRSDPPK